MKKLIPIGIAVLCFLPSCSDDGDNSLNSGETEISEEVLQHNNLITLVSSLFNPQIDESSSSPTLRYGRVLDESQPGVYSMCVKDFDEAYELVEGFGVPMEQSGNAYVMNFGKYGKATLNKSSRDGSLLGTLDLQLDTLKSISQLRFLEQGSIPESNAITAFKRGDIVRYNNNPANTYICIAQQTANSPCVLLRYYSHCNDIKISGMDYTYGYDVPDEGFAFQRVQNLSGTILSSVGAKALQTYIKEDKTGWDTALTQYADNTSLTTCFLHFYYSWGYFYISKDIPSSLNDISSGIANHYWMSKYIFDFFSLSSTFFGKCEAYKADGTHYSYNSDLFDDVRNPFEINLNAILLEDYSLGEDTSNWEVISEATSVE